jgi:hypothetical protein
MTMLTATEILQRHPQGCWVFDATGRRLAMTCSPVTLTTGEAVRLVPRRRAATAWFMMGLLPPRPTWPWLYRSEIPRRHGFWPAPLHIVPKPVWNGDPEQYAPVPRRGGRVPDGQAYIVGNGEREELTAWHNTRDRLAAGAADSEPQRKLTMADIDALVDAMDGGDGEREAFHQ